MDELDRQMLFPGYALHVHQTRGVGPRDILGPGSEMTVDLVNTHATAHSLLLDGKHTTVAVCSRCLRSGKVQRAVKEPAVSVEADA